MKPTKDCPEYNIAISVEKMRLSDKYTIENLIPSKELMYRAAQGIYDNINPAGKKIAVVCGSGNNGGDGYALCVILAKNGITADIYRLSDKFSEDGKYYYDMATSLGVQEKEINENTSFEEYDIVVDCIFGTGFNRTPEGIAADVIKKINDTAPYVVSADINSGLNGDTGEGKLAVKSDLTVSIGYYKTGMFIGDAPELIGNIVNVDIGIVLV